MIKFDKIVYPDGQISVKVTDWDDNILRVRINSYEDLFVIASIADIADYVGNKIDLTIVCMFGQRSDRRFEPRQSYDLKLICKFINSCNFQSIKVFDPHSELTLGLLDYPAKISPNHYIKMAINDIASLNLTLVSPDAGAYKKVFDIGEVEGLPVVAASKHRTLAGVVDLVFVGDVKGKDCLIIDDLLDGGFTFRVLAEKLKAQGANKVYLYISHAYFNKGVDFTIHIDHFYCTNSVKNIKDPKVTQFKII